MNLGSGRPVRSPGSSTILVVYYRPEGVFIHEQESLRVSTLHKVTAEVRALYFNSFSCAAKGSLSF